MNAKDNTSEEIDLGQLFKLIGKAINTFFNCIAIFFKTIYHFFILFLQFLRVHLFKFFVAAVLGIGVGGFMDNKMLPRYRSSMIVKPNFNSTQLLYNNIEFYNQLIKEQENKALAKALHISESKAEDLKKIKIFSLSDEIYQIEQFSEFIRNLDSISQKNVDYKDYLKNFKETNAEYHQIEIEATTSGIAKKCQKAIVTSVENNEYFGLMKEANDENIALRDSMIKQEDKEINNLQTFYKKIKVLEAKKLDGTTNINLAENKTEEALEIKLLDQKRKLKDEKINLNLEKTDTKNIINIVSKFEDRGVLIKDLYYKKIIFIPILFVGILFLVLVMIPLNKYLINYNK
ncbi:hypothetical protein Q4Q35_00895 [Flavivirga aquimarina]|uniref:Polysaccharide chain length determinant N-terminal domain-containing protein n=1 Tax=Flavivirga aquimarina TaxID=2027862 RepID=A0ABT8W5K0_9FLAO|nr:hypothetical protein [Flavivirga aquimarina]MDO5968352.1 hypothetical protein [Flavivirga aquimarina]